MTLKKSEKRLYILKIRSIGRIFLLLLGRAQLFFMGSVGECYCLWEKVTKDLFMTGVLLSFNLYTLEKV